MNKFLHLGALLCALMTTSVITHAQTNVSSETFPTPFNNAPGAFGVSGTFSGSQGSWTVTASSTFGVQVNSTITTSTPHALRLIYNTPSASPNITDNVVTSPVTSLSFGNCMPSAVNLTYRLYPSDVEDGNNNVTFGLQFFNGTAWTTVQSLTANQLSDNYNEGAWNTVTVSVPNTYWNANFRYRFYMIKNSTISVQNSTDLWIDDITITATMASGTTPDFSDPSPIKTTDGGAPGGGFEVGDVYRFNNVITTPVAIYAEVKIEAMVNAMITNLDNNAAGIAQRFQPRIRPDVLPLTADREGYVQFAITFRKASDNNVVFLDGLRYKHFDVDGSMSTTGAGAYTFRETGWVTNNATVMVSTPTGLADGGTIVDAGPPSTTTWKKVLGATVEHNGITSDPDAAFTAVYGPLSVLRVRLGYIFDETGTNASYNPGAEGREYATEFGCFDVTEQSTLPLSLIGFSASYRNNATTLSWETVNEDNFDKFEIERSSNGSSYSVIGTKQSLAGGPARKNYTYFDDLSAVQGSVFYYRLRMIDLDGQFKYSNVVMVKKEQKNLTGIAVNPNPVVNGIATVRFSAARNATVDFRVVDMAGRTILQQQNKVYEGNNSVSLNNLDRLQPGVYTLQMANGDDEVSVVKFSVTR